MAVFNGLHRSPGRQNVNASTPGQGGFRAGLEGCMTASCVPAVRAE